MSTSLTDHIETLRDLNLQLRRQLEQAEAIVPELNRVVEQLRSIGLLDEAMLLGDVIHQGNYDHGSCFQDSGWVLQVAFIIGQGLGTITWDMEDYFSFVRHGCTSKTTASVNFSEFDELSPAVKALIMPHVGIFVQRIGQLAGADFN